MTNKFIIIHLEKKIMSGIKVLSVGIILALVIGIILLIVGVTTGTTSDALFIAGVTISAASLVGMFSLSVYNASRTTYTAPHNGSNSISTGHIPLNTDNKDAEPAHSGVTVQLHGVTSSSGSSLSGHGDRKTPMHATTIHDPRYMPRVEGGSMEHLLRENLYILQGSDGWIDSADDDNTSHEEYNWDNVSNDQPIETTQLYTTAVQQERDKRFGLKWFGKLDNEQDLIDRTKDFCNFFYPEGKLDYSVWYPGRAWRYGKLGIITANDVEKYNPKYREIVLESMLKDHVQRYNKRLKINIDAGILKALTIEDCTKITEYEKTKDISENEETLKAIVNLKCSDLFKLLKNIEKITAVWGLRMYGDENFSYTEQDIRNHPSLYESLSKYASRFNTTQKQCKQILGEFENLYMLGHAVYVKVDGVEQQTFFFELLDMLRKSYGNSFKKIQMLTSHCSETDKQLIEATKSTFTKEYEMFKEVCEKYHWSGYIP
jgi:hypothetical protein